MSNYVAQHLAESRALEFFSTELWDEFPTALDTLYGRDADGYTTAVGSLVIPGIYLPDPKVWAVQSGPSTELFKDIGFVSGFVGPTGEASMVGDAANAAIGVGFVWQVNQEFAVSLVLGVAPQKPVTVDGRKLRPEEILRYRASYYAGALANVAFSKFYGRAECWGIRPLGRSSQQSEIRISSEQYALVAVASFEFTVVSKQLFPPHN